MSVNPEEHLGLVYKAANRYNASGWDYDDLVGYGMIGLVDAARKFNDSKGIKFSTYATHYIHGYIKRALNFNGNSVGDHKMKIQGKTQTVTFIEDLLPEDMDELSLDVDGMKVDDFSEIAVGEIYLDDLLNNLNKIEKEVLIQHVFNDKSLADIAREKKVSRQYTCNIFRNVKKKLKPILEKYHRVA